jgi:flagellin-like protein
MQLLKIEKRKGISPLIATLLLIAIAVAASVLTYSWVMSMIGSQSAQAQTQIRIDSVRWVSGTAFALDVRNTGSVDAVIESVSVRENKAGSSAQVSAPDAATGFITAIGAGTHGKVGNDVNFSPPLELGKSYVIRATTNTGFYYEAVFSAPADAWTP